MRAVMTIGLGAMLLGAASMGCAQQSPEAAAPISTEAETSAAAENNATANAGGVQLAANGSATQAAPGSAETAQPITLGGVTAALPANWVEKPAAGQFRMAQYELPKADGDAAAPLFIVFHFGKGGGGGVEENVQRWIGMMKQPEGTDVSKVVKRGQVEKTGLKITSLDIPGTYQDRPFPASPQITPRPNYRMLAAIVETTYDGGEGPYYLRIVGPAKSVEAARKGWDTLLQSLKAP